MGTFSLAPNAEQIALHEMGHTAFDLADEYEYYRGCTSGETDRNNHPATEPAEVNVTTNTDRATLKWQGFVTAPATPWPTTKNANCTQCDPQASPVAAGTVGLFEGAHYFHCGAFRPEFNCKMQALTDRTGTIIFPFCAVCRKRIRRVLAPYLLPRSFVPVYAQGSPGNGIGGYDLADPADRVFAFDYNGSGRLDHLALYRPGFGTIWILRSV